MGMKTASSAAAKSADLAGRKGNPDPAAILRQVRASAEHAKSFQLWGMFDPNIRISIDASERISEDASVALYSLWEVAAASNEPKAMISVALDFCKSFTESLVDLRSIVSRSSFVERGQIKQLTIRTMQWLNEWAAWKLLGYQDLGQEWRSVRQAILESVESGVVAGGETAGGGATRDAGVSAEGLISPHYLNPDITSSLVASVLLENSATQSLSRLDIADLVRGIWLVASYIPLRRESDGDACHGYLQYDATSGRVLRHVAGETSIRPGGASCWLIYSDDILRAVNRVFPLRDGMPRDTNAIERPLRHQLSDQWAAKPIPRRCERRRSTTHVYVFHGYAGVVSRMSGSAKFIREERPNAEISDITERGCCLAMTREKASSVMAPGQLIAIAGIPGGLQMRCGIVAWMKGGDANPDRICIGVAFIDGAPSVAILRSGQAFPSGLQTAKLLRFEEAEQSGANLMDIRQRMVVPKGTFREGLELVDTDSGTRYVATRVVKSGPDFQLVELVPAESDLARCLRNVVGRFDGEHSQRPCVV